MPDDGERVYENWTFRKEQLYPGMYVSIPSDAKDVQITTETDIQMMWNGEANVPVEQTTYFAVWLEKMPTPWWATWRRSAASLTTPCR